MPKSVSPKYNRDIISRTVAVASVRASAGVLAAHRRGEEPEIEAHFWLELRGHLSEPVEGTTVVSLGMHPRDRLLVGSARPAAVGAIVQLNQRCRPSLPGPTAISTGCGRSLPPGR